MNLNRTVIASAVGALFVAGTGPAFALNQATTAAIPAGSQVFMSGATAQDTSIRQALRSGCTAGTLDLYVFTGANAQTIYSCSGYNAAGNLAIWKDSAVGSSNGVTPFAATPTPIQFAALSNVTSGCTVTATTTPPAFNTWACGSAPTLNAAIKPDIGFSDVEPAIFGFSSLPGVAATNGIVSANQVVFGLQLSKLLYTTLQTAQGTTGRPSLTSAQAAGLLSGNLVNGTDLGIAAGSIFIARRGNDSGTQKAAEVNFLQQNIITPPPTAFVLPTFGSVATGAATSLNATDPNFPNLTAGCGNGTTAPTGGRIFAGSGSGDVDNCVSYHGGNRYAVGIQGVNRNENAGFTNTTNANYPTTAANTTAASATNGQYWRYAKLDGVAPTAANVIRGLYTHWVEQSVQQSSTISAQGTTVYTKLVADLRDNTTLGTSNSGAGTTFLEEPAGQQKSGNVAIPGPVSGVNGGLCSAVFAGTVTADTDPTNNATKSAGGAPNSATKPATTVCPPRF